MKKRIKILKVIIVTLCFSTIGAMSCKEAKTESLQTIESKDVAINTNVVIEKPNKTIFTDFIYEIGPRFSPIKKSDIEKATSIATFFDEKQLQAIESLNTISVIFIINDEQSDIRATGTSEQLNKAQLNLLKSAGYSTHFLIRADYKMKNEETGELEDSYSTPHLTIVPEKQAEYLDDSQQLINRDGKMALKEYLKNHSLEARTKANVDAEKLKPAKLYFTVSKTGIIENVRLDRSSNYPIVDDAMIELIKNAPGEWLPAENIDGEKVDQELVVSVGLMGC